MPDAGALAFVPVCHHTVSFADAFSNPKLAFLLRSTVIRRVNDSVYVPKHYISMKAHAAHPVNDNPYYGAGGGGGYVAGGSPFSAGGSPGGLSRVRTRSFVTILRPSFIGTTADRSLTFSPTTYRVTDHKGDTGAHRCRMDDRGRRNWSGAWYLVLEFDHIGATYCDTQVTIVAQVISIQSQTTNSVYWLDDGSGRIEARHWVDSASEVDSEKWGGISYVERLLASFYWP